MATSPLSPRKKSSPSALFPNDSTCNKVVSSTSSAFPSTRRKSFAGSWGLNREKTKLKKQEHTNTKSSENDSSSRPLVTFSNYHVDALNFRQSSKKIKRRLSFPNVPIIETLFSDSASIAPKNERQNKSRRRSVGAPFLFGASSKVNDNKETPRRRSSFVAFIKSIQKFNKQNATQIISAETFSTNNMQKTLFRNPPDDLQKIAADAKKDSCVNSIFHIPEYDSLRRRSCEFAISLHRPTVTAPSVHSRQSSISQTSKLGLKDTSLAQNTSKVEIIKQYPDSIEYAELESQNFLSVHTIYRSLTTEDLDDMECAVALANVDSTDFLSYELDPFSVDFLKQMNI